MTYLFTVWQRLNGQLLDPIQLEGLEAQDVLYKSN